MLNDHQIKRLKLILNGDWEGEPDQFLAGVESSLELHVLSILPIWNYEEGKSDYFKILQHKLCDLGQAVLMYWTHNPGWLYKKKLNSRPLSDSEKSDWDFIVRIEAMIGEGGFIKGNLGFDPIEHCSRTGYRHSDFVPDSMRRATTGHPIPLDYSVLLVE